MSHEEASSDANTLLPIQKATQDEISQIVGAWTASPEGQAMIREGQENAWKAVLKLREARRIKDVNILRKPRAPERRAIFPK